MRRHSYPKIQSTSTFIDRLKSNSRPSSPSISRARQYIKEVSKQSNNIISTIDMSSSNNFTKSKTNVTFNFLNCNRRTSFDLVQISTEQSQQRSDVTCNPVIEQLPQVENFICQKESDGEEENGSTNRAIDCFDRPASLEVNKNSNKIDPYHFHSCISDKIEDTNNSIHCSNHYLDHVKDKEYSVSKCLNGFFSSGGSHTTMHSNKQERISDDKQINRYPPLFPTSFSFLLSQNENVTSYQSYSFKTVCCCRHGLDDSPFYISSSAAPLVGCNDNNNCWFSTISHPDQCNTSKEIISLNKRKPKCICFVKKY